MLTNLIDKFLHLSMLFKQDIQTGMLVFLLIVSIQEQVKRSADGWSYLLKNKISYSKHQVSDLKEQDQELNVSRPRWSEVCRIKDEDQCMTICLEENTRVCVILLYFLGSCVYNFAKYAELNHTHKEKVFKEKKLDTLSQDQGLRSMYQLFLYKNT